MKNTRPSGRASWSLGCYCPEGITGQAVLGVVAVVLAPVQHRCGVRGRPCMGKALLLGGVLQPCGRGRDYCQVDCANDQGRDTHGNEGIHEKHTVVSGHKCRVNGFGRRVSRQRGGRRERIALALACWVTVEDAGI